MSNPIKMLEQVEEQIKQVEINYFQLIGQKALLEVMIKEDDGNDAKESESVDKKG